MSKKFTFYPQGVCSMMIELELEGDVIKDVIFTGGCNGNLSGISKLIKGMKAEDVIERLEGTTCGFKNTSCPDQLSKALREALAS
ncbi:MAG: TIGR03905 family TSCPD domain-containing protein [Mogibacterium sp.]|nr:TIGR03905 family TSCPD domain-containing protein [Mogibacterium sp.]MBR2539730.1 TIGR03905 family TSCPD domain-containing protein [Mogibacterium sp.]